MSPEELMQDSDALMVAMHAENVAQIDETTNLRTVGEQTKLLGAVGFTARRMHEVLELKRRARARIAADARAIKASVMKARAKAMNDNEAAPQEEQEMDDDSGRTPERIAALHTELQRRLAALAARREGKSLARGHASVGDPACDGGSGARAGGPPTPSA